VERWQLRPAADLGLPLRQQLLSLRRECGLLGTAGHLLWQATVRGYLAAFHRLAVEGRAGLPAAPPFVMVANHTSHLDALVLASTLPLGWRDRIFPIAAADTFFTGLPQLGFAVGALNALPLRRRRAGAEHLAQLRLRLTQEGAIFILFPEGTRSRTGAMAAFKPGLGALVAGSPIPVVPCHIDGAFAALPPHRRLPRPRRLRLRIGPPLEFSATANDKVGWAEIAARTQAAVEALAR
jgi:1-acyl-sn-glycerol-3-phosphate acyltransferase